MALLISECRHGLVDAEFKNLRNRKCFFLSSDVNLKPKKKKVTELETGLFRFSRIFHAWAAAHLLGSLGTQRSDIKTKLHLFLL